jgi:hypothetical protein
MFSSLFSLSRTEIWCTLKGVPSMSILGSSFFFKQKEDNLS